MDTIVKKLNEKVTELGGEGKGKTVVEALNEIAEVTGGTPTEKNTIVDALDGVNFEGGGVETFQLIIKCNFTNSGINIKWLPSIDEDDLYVANDSVGAKDEKTYVIAESNSDAPKKVAFYVTSNYTTTGAGRGVDVEGALVLIHGAIQNERGKEYQALIYAEFREGTNRNVIIFKDRGE